MVEMTKQESTPAKTPLLTLATELSAEGQVSSDIRVGWCLSPELVREVEVRQFKNPHVVLVIRNKQTTDYDGHTVSRYTETGYRISKLKAGLNHVYFSRPGDNEVVAIIVDVRDNKDAKKLWDLQGRTDWELLNDDGTIRDWRDRLPSSNIEGGFILEVKVPREMFAKEPAPWRKRMVSIIFGDNKGNDQCGFRKRWLFSLVVLPPLMVLSALARVVLLLGGLYASWDKYEWAYMKPWNSVPVDIFDESGKFTMFQRRHDLGYGYVRKERRPWPFFVLNQFTIWLVPVIVYGVFNARGHWDNSKHEHSLVDWGWWQTFWVVNACIVGALLALLVGFGLFMFVTWVGGQVFKLALFTRMRARSQATAAKREEERKLADQRRNDALLQELSSMICVTGKAAPRTLEELPANKRTVVLRFYDLKAKVCKPFAR